MHPRIFALAALLLCPAGASRADEVTLNDGTRLHGKVTVETPASVVIEAAGGRRVLAWSEVRAVSKTPDVVLVMKNNVLGPTPDPVVADAPVDLGTWPPIPDAPYPDLALLDGHGRVFRLSSLRGKTILVEPVAMTSPACQALSGGHEYGGFGGVKPQENVESVDANLRKFAHGLRLDNPNIEYVQVVVYNQQRAAPTVAEVRAWAEHFHLADRPNVHVLVGTPAMISAETFDMIPGLHLVDRHFILRSEHFGRGGGSDLYRELLPLAAHLVAQAD